MTYTHGMSLTRAPQPVLPPYVAVETPRVMIAGRDSSELRFLKRVLDAAGYWVESAIIDDESRPRAAARALLGNRGLELLVLDGASQSNHAARLLDALREVAPSLPIILIAADDPELRDEARRLGVDVVLDAPVTIAELRRAAQDMAPLFPQVGERVSSRFGW